MSKIIIVDVEADGERPGVNSMVCFGAVLKAQKGDFFFQHITCKKFQIIEEDENFFSLWNVTDNCEANTHFHKFWLESTTYTLLFNEYDLWI